MRMYPVVALAVRWHLNVLRMVFERHSNVSDISKKEVPAGTSFSCTLSVLTLGAPPFVGRGC